MSVLDQIKDMEEKGFSEQQIINKLQEQEGNSPQEISDALNRSKIKNAVSPPNQNTNEEGMQPSIMTPEKELGGSENYGGVDSPKPSSSYQKKFASKTKEMSSEQEMPAAPIPAPPVPGQAHGFQESYAPPQQYSNPPAQMGFEEDDGSYDSGEYAPDTDTMIEISEQVFAEKMKPVLEKIEKTIEFKTLSETKIENISHRLKRIESQIDDLQSAILEKVGGYGRGLEGVRKEMSMVQDSFGKIVNDLAEKHSKKHHSRKTVVHRSEKKTTVIHKSAKKKKSSKKK